MKHEEQDKETQSQKLRESVVNESEAQISSLSQLEQSYRPAARTDLTHVYRAAASRSCHSPSEILLDPGAQNRVQRAAETVKEAPVWGEVERRNGQKSDPSVSWERDPAGIKC